MKRVLAFTTAPLFWGILAFVLFCAFRAPWLYPGDEAELIARYTGALPALGLGAHPLLEFIGRGIASVLPPVQWVGAFHLLGALFGAICVWALSKFVQVYLMAISEERFTLPLRATACRIASSVSALTLLTSGLFVVASTHLQWQIFDLLLILLVAICVAKTRTWTHPIWIYVTTFFMGFIALESDATLVSVPILWMLLIRIFTWADDSDTPVLKLFFRTTIPLLVGVLVFMAIYVTGTLLFGASGSAASALSHHGMSTVAGALAWLTGPWILILLLTILPALVSLPAALRLCNNDRKPVATIVYLILGVATCAGSIYGIPSITESYALTYPVLIIALMALFNSLWCAIGLYLWKITRRPEGGELEPEFRPIARVLGLIMPFAILGFQLCFGIRSLIASHTPEGEMLPRMYTDQVINALPEEVWILGDATLDPYLAIRVAESERPITILSLANDRDRATLEKVQQSVRKAAYFAEKPELRDQLLQTLDVGILPFLQDWIKADPDSVKHFLTISLPDIWIMSDRMPMPNNLWFQGFVGANELKEYFAKLTPPKAPLDIIDYDKDNTAIPAGVHSFSSYMRRQASFIANNIAFYLIDYGNKEDAYQLARATYEYYPDNVCAFFNTYELINGGLHPEAQAWCTSEMTKLMRQLQGRKYLWIALARNFGYIHSPQLMSALAGTWVMSGQTGAAMATLDMAYAMLNASDSTAMQQAVAQLYTITPGKRNESIQRYEALLAKSTDELQSKRYIRELIRLALMNDDVAKAKELLAQVTATTGPKDPEWAYDRALIAVRDGDIKQAYSALQICLDKNPKDMEALAMLATMQMEAKDIDTLKSSTLQRLITAAGTENNYYVQIIRAQLNERDGKFDVARANYMHALKLRPEVYSLRDAVLRLDIRLNDKTAAEDHARNYLYQERTYPLANYVMGSIALGKNEIDRAIGYLKLAANPASDPALPVAVNDLAEAYRLSKQYDEALATVRMHPEFYKHLPIIKETEATILMAQGHNEEALAAVDEAIKTALELTPDKPCDVRFHMTKVEICLAKNDKVAATKAFQELAKQSVTINTPELNARYEKLRKAIQLH